MTFMRSIVAVAALALGTSAFAGSIQVNFSSTASLRGLGSFSGSAEYNSTTDQLTLDITNTGKGELTSFALNAPSGDSAQYEAAKHSPWKDERNHKGMINARPYGEFDAGAAVHGRWGSTAARLGIEPGQTREFIFDIAGPTADTLTTLDFFNSTTPEIVAAYAGFSHRKTDRASGFGHEVVPDSTPSNTIPTNLDPGGSTAPSPTTAQAGMAILATLMLFRFGHRMCRTR